MREYESNFPIDVNSRLINGLQIMIIWCIKILAILMTLTVIWSVIDVAINLYTQAIKPPYLIVNMDELLACFGSFLVVLIAIEIFMNIILYLRKDMGHLRLVLATALMAIARKIIILDYDHTPTYQIFGMGAVIAALGFAYWIVAQPAKQSTRKEIIES